MLILWSQMVVFELVTGVVLGVGVMEGSLFAYLMV